MNFACLKPTHTHGNLIIYKIFIPPPIVCSIQLPLNLFEYQSSSADVTSMYKYTCNSTLSHSIVVFPFTTQKQQLRTNNIIINYHNVISSYNVNNVCGPNYRVSQKSLFTYRRRRMYLKAPCTLTQIHFLYLLKLQ